MPCRSNTSLPICVLSVAVFLLQWQEVSSYKRGLANFLEKARYYLRVCEPEGLCHENAGDLRKVQSLSTNTIMATEAGLVDHIA